MSGQGCFIGMSDGPGGRVRIVLPHEFEINRLEGGELEIIAPTLGRACELSEAVRFFVECRQSFSPDAICRETA